MAVSDIAFTPVVKHAQAERGSRAIYEKVEQRGGWRDRIDSMLADFIAERDSFYLATAGADGQPYIQHRDQRVSSRLRWNRPKTPVPRPPLIAASDIRRLLAHAGGWAGTRLTPASWDSRIVATLQRLWSWSKRDVVQKVAGRIEIAAPGRFSSGQARRLAAEWVAIRAELDWARARATQGRAPETTLEPPGAERLRAALNAGRGAVLWFSSFSDSWLLFRGLAAAGFRVQHLSRRTHGAPSGRPLQLLDAEPLPAPRRGPLPGAPHRDGPARRGRLRPPDPARLGSEPAGHGARRPVADERSGSGSVVRPNGRLSARRAGFRSPLRGGAADCLLPP